MPHDDPPDTSNDGALRKRAACVPGARVWYEPAAGLRFAGGIIGDGTLPDTRRVLLSAHYWRWRTGSVSARPDSIRAAPAPAIAISHLYDRGEHDGMPADCDTAYASLGVGDAP